MGELQKEYGTQANFVVVPSAETLQRMDEVNGFGFEDLKHGLVVFDADGEAQAKLPGHQFGRPEIEAALLAVLEAD